MSRFIRFTGLNQFVSVSKKLKTKAKKLKKSNHFFDMLDAKDIKGGKFKTHQTQLIKNIVRAKNPVNRIVHALGHELLYAITRKIVARFNSKPRKVMDTRRLLLSYLPINLTKAGITEAFRHGKTPLRGLSFKNSRIAPRFRVTSTPDTGTAKAKRRMFFDNRRIINFRRAGQHQDYSIKTPGSKIQLTSNVPSIYTRPTKSSLLKVHNERFEEALNQKINAALSRSQNDQARVVAEMELFLKELGLAVGRGLRI